jgi:6,7-dimethyl-8-ribityllumazine synthase
MATANKNLSAYDKSQMPDASNYKVGVVVSEWNEKVTGGLLSGAVEALKDLGVAEENLHVHYVPGSYELPLGAQFLFTATEVDAVICLGSVIQGETRHFDFVCEAVAQGVKDVSLKFNKPCIFGVLTDNTLAQALARSGGEHGNKGTEAAVTAIKMVGLMKSFGKGKSKLGY